MTKWLTAILMASVLIASGVARADDDDADDDGDDLEFQATLSGAQEVPGVATDGEGEIKADFDDGLSEVKVRLSVENLTGDITAAHFHCNRAGANGPIAFGLVSPGPCAFDDGRLRCTLTNDDLTDVANACEGVVGRPVSNIAALAFAMRDGLIYINVHTTTFGGGEIRGQMLPD